MWKIVTVGRRGRQPSARTQSKAVRLINLTDNLDPSGMRAHARIHLAQIHSLNDCQSAVPRRLARNTRMYDNHRYRR